jgi:hypothetical protein
MVRLGSIRVRFGCRFSDASGIFWPFLVGSLGTAYLCGSSKVSGDPSNFQYLEIVFQGFEETFLTL